MDIRFGVGNMKLRMAINSTILFMLIMGLLNPMISLSQKRVYLKPSLGMQFPFSYKVKGGDESFHVNNLNFGLDAGLLFQYDWNAKNSLVVGINSAGMGYSFRYGTVSNGFKTRNSVTSNLLVLPFGYQKYLTTVNMFRLKTPEELYAVLFRLRLISGLSYYYLQPMTDDNSSYLACNGNCEVQDNIIQRRGGSVFVGLNLQFFNFERDSFQFTMIYSQGFSNQLTSKVNYRLSNSGLFNETATIISRGSYLSLQISYPIKLWKQKTDQSQ